MAGGYDASGAHDDWSSGERCHCFLLRIRELTWMDRMEGMIAENPGNVGVTGFHPRRIVHALRASMMYLAS